MTIVNADPKGRVVLVWPEKMVLVLDRCEIVCIKVDGGDLQIKTKRSIGDGVWASDESVTGWINVQIGLGAVNETDAEYETRTLAVYNSIIAEDDDIVWTRTEGGWIRVPDGRTE